MERPQTRGNGNGDSGKTSSGFDGLQGVVESPDVFNNPNVVKVVITGPGNALDVSCTVIPDVREGGPATHYMHLGIYAFRREFLLELVQMPQSKLERLGRLLLPCGLLSLSFDQ